ncbi:MAG: TatD family hydrolase [Patescibacteria group bacterium]|nr:TatD family hydrolase [Patescibacteria group bacterium]MCL5432422.1 TatD family hydrolase [Patescibacteria group bacterium]
MLIDSHCHLTKKFCPDVDQTLAQAKDAGVEKIITIGTTLEDSQEGIEIAQNHDGVYAAVGIHPEESCANWGKFEQLAQMPRVAAIGECGLDYKVGLPGQKEIFEKQIGIARKLNLPLSIHIRDAQDDLMKMDLAGTRGVFHCFSGDERYLNFILTKLPDFYISFAGNVTFKNASGLQQLAKLVPLERLLVETDSPFLAPHPLRGSQNTPANVKITVQFLADLKSISLEELSKITSKNAQILFGI